MFEFTLGGLSNEKWQVQNKTYHICKQKHWEPHTFDKATL